MTESDGHGKQGQGRAGGLLQRLRNLQAREKRLLFWLAVSLAIGIVLMNLGDNGDAQLFTGGSESYAQPETSAAPAADDLERKLTVLLAEVKGAGRVAVAVVYSESAETIYVWEREASEQSDAESRSSSEKSNLAAVNDMPVMVKQFTPKVQGITVVASGAGDALVRERLYQAVRGLTGLSAGQIAIIEGEGSD